MIHGWPIGHCASRSTGPPCAGPTAPLSIAFASNKTIIGPWRRWRSSACSSTAPRQWRWAASRPGCSAFGAASRPHLPLHEPTDQMSREKILDIEILRALAVIGVVIHHARTDLFTWSSPGLERLGVFFGGWVGVDLFFAISGFVIGRSLLARLLAAGNNRLDSAQVILAFWVRRAWRLLPSAWLWLLLILAGAIAFRESGTFGDLRANLEATVAGFLQIANLRFLETFMRSEYGASFVYWSLSLEEQFYLLLPIVVLLSRRWLVPVLLFIVIYQLLQERTLAMMMFRCDGMLLG